jgi:glutamate-1-semialdehyde 2,1-aminomutase
MRVFQPALVFTRAKGGYVWDADGQQYVDYHAAFGPIILGHGDARVASRAFQAVSELDLTGGGPSRFEIELAEKIVQHVPSAERVLFCNSGSEATYHAVRVSRAFTGRRLVVKFQGCFHGWHDYLAANVISEPKMVGRMDPISAGIGEHSLSELVVLPFNDADAFESLMEQRGDQIAAVILEPIIHTIGCVLPKSDFLTALRKETTRHGSLLIFDEVVTGFRHALGGYQAICGITPDLTTLGKAIANGYPLAVLAGREDVMTRFATAGGDVMIGGTFNGHPLTTAAALATIEELERDSGAAYKHLYSLGAKMRNGLDEITERLAIPARPVNFGSVFVCYFTNREVHSFDDALTSDAELYVGFHRAMIERGFFMPPLNLKRNHLMVAHTEEDVDRTLQAAEDALKTLPKPAKTAR